MKIFKTLFLITVISLIAITVNATTVDTTSKSTIVTDSTLTFLKVYEDIKSDVIGLANVLKMPAEHVYRVMVKQQVIDALSGTLFIVIMLILLFLSIRYLKACNNNPDIKDISGPVVLLIIVSIITFTVLMVAGSTVLTGFFNPEYGAMRDIVNFVNYHPR